MINYVKKSLASSFFARATGFFVMLAVTALAYRQFSGQELTLILLIIGLSNLVNFSDLGLGNSLVNRLIDSKQPSRIYINYLYKSIGIGFCYGLVVITLFLTMDLDLGWLLFGCYLSLQTPISLASKYKLALKKISSDQLYFSIGRLCSLLLVMVSCEFEVSAEVFITLFLLGDLFYKLINTLSIKVAKEVNGQDLKYKVFDKRFFYYFLFQGFYVFLFTGDQFLVRYFYEPHIVSSFYATQRLFDLIPVVVMIVMSPIWAVLRNGELEQSLFLGKVKKIFIPSLSILAIINMFIYFFGGEIFILWLGDGYKFDFELVLLLTLQAYLFSIYHMFNILLQSVDKYKEQFLLILLAFSLALLLKLGFEQFGIIYIPLVNVLVFILLLPLFFIKTIKS